MVDSSIEMVEEVLLTIEELREKFANLLQSCRYVQVSKLPDGLYIEELYETEEEFDQVFFFDSEYDAKRYASFVPHIYNCTYCEEFNVYVVCVQFINMSVLYDDSALERYRKEYTELMNSVGTKVTIVKERQKENIRRISKCKNNNENK